MKQQFWFVLIALILFGVMLSGCAGMQTQSVSHATTETNRSHRSPYPIAWQDPARPVTVITPMSASVQE